MNKPVFADGSPNEPSCNSVAIICAWISGPGMSPKGAAWMS